MEFENLKNLKNLKLIKIEGEESDKDYHNSPIEPVLIDKSIGPFYFVDRNNLIQAVTLERSNDDTNLNERTNLDENKENEDIKSNKNEKIFSKRSSLNTFKNLGIKIGKLIGLSERQTSKKSYFDKQDKTKDEDREDTLTQTLKDTVKDTVKSKFKNSYKALRFEREEEENSIDNEFKQIVKLANFIEKNLRIIGLEPVYQLLSSNRTANLEETFKNLVKQIDLKLVQNNSKTNLLDENSLLSMKRKRSMKRRTADNEDDEDDLNDIELLHELEDYIRSKRRIAKVREDDHDFEIKKFNRRNFNTKNRLNSRKRRSRKLNTKKTSRLTNRSQELRRRNLDNLRKSNRLKKLDRLSKRKRSKGYNLQSYDSCNSSNEESCEESEIHEQYVPFTSNDQQMSESYDQQQSTDNNYSRGEENEQPYSNEQGNQYNDAYSSNEQYSSGNPNNNQYSNNDDAYFSNEQQNNQYSNQEQNQEEFRHQEEGNFSKSNLKSNVKYDQNYQTENYMSNANGDYEYTNGLNSPYHQTNFEEDELNYYADKQQFNPFLTTSDYIYETKPHASLHHLHTIKKLNHLKHFKKHIPIHLQEQHHLNDQHFNEHHHPHSEPHHPHEHKDDLTLTKELITNLLIDNQHKIFALLKATKFAHLFVSKKFIAVALQVFFGKG